MLRLLSTVSAFALWMGHGMSKLFVALLANVLALMSGSVLADGDGRPQPNKQANDSWLQRTGDFPKKPAKKKPVTPTFTTREHLPAPSPGESADLKTNHKLTNEERQKALADQSKKGSGQ
jgi:hypothetical protein